MKRKVFLLLTMIIAMFICGNILGLDDNESRFYTETWNNGVRKNIITDYGAKINDGQDDSQALQKAIDELTKLPNGGRIDFPKGTYHLKFIRLKSNVHLVFAAGSIIKIPPNDNKWGYIFDAGNQEKVENISIRGNGGRFTVDIRTAKPNELLTVFRLSNASNFYIAEVNVLDNYTTFPVFATGKGYQNGITRNGIFKNATLTNAHYGYGMVQTGAAKTILFKNLDGGGGVTLRLETAITGVTIDDIVARNIISRNGHAAVFISPHHITGGIFDIHDVKAYGSGYAVRIERGFGNPRGTFNGNSKINKIYAQYGTKAQIRSDHVVYLPCQLKNLAVKNTVIDLGTAQTSYTAPSIAPILYEQGSGAGYYNVNLSKITKSGFTYQPKTIINTGDKINESDCDNSGNGNTTGDVTIYQHCSYGGYSVGLSVGSYTLNQLTALGLSNDDASSIKVSSGYKVTVYQHVSFGGYSTSFSSDIGCLSGQTGGRGDGSNWNDDISSIKVEKVGNSSTDAPIGTWIWLKAYNGRYICADKSLANTPLVANRTGLGSWEKFQVVDAGSGYIALKANSNGKYASVRNNVSGAPLRAEAGSIGEWEKLTWSKVSSNKVAFKAKINGKYTWSQNNQTNAPLYAKGSSIQGWETFIWGATTKSAGAEGSLTGYLVYPNPVNNELNILLNGELHQDASIMIYSSTGALLLSAPLTSNILQLPTHHLANGMYVLKLVNGADVNTQRFIKE